MAAKSSFRRWLSWAFSGRSIAFATLVLNVGLVSSGCGSSEPEVSTPIPLESPFASVKPDMGVKQVTDLIGPPTDVDAHITGKTFVPFYMGNDGHRVVHHYKGMGRIIYTGSDLRVLKVEYDPKESGYR